MITGRLRRSAAALTAAAVLLVGCGSEESGSAGPTRSQVQAVVPDAEAMPGWETSSKPQARRLEGTREGALCEMADACDGARVQASSHYALEEKALLSTFQVVAYEDETSAKAAYPLLWERHRRMGDPRELELGDIGAKSDGRVGKSGNAGEVAAIYQVRAGTLILVGTVVSHGREEPLDKTTVRQLAAMFTERAQQSQDGERPSAALQGT